MQGPDRRTHGVEGPLRCLLIPVVLAVALLTHRTCSSRCRTSSPVPARRGRCPSWNALDEHGPGRGDRAGISDDVVLVATDTGTMAHRPDCVVVAGKTGVRAVSANAGLAACKLFDPYGGLTN